MEQVITFVPQTPAGWLPRLGDAMRRHRGLIQGTQWTVVAFYLVLLLVPALRPLPADEARIYNDITRLAQFVFWGVWWPFVMLSTMFLGRVWCGVFCPEGALTEYASRRGLGRAIPRWVRWGGWPFVAFALTTVFGQLVSVYEYPKAALLILGGSTVAAVAVGYVYGRGKRVWCRYLCPANGVFRLLAKLAPVHFRTDAAAWRAAPRAAAPNCAPLVDLRHLAAGDCHACGRCSDYRNAVWLQARSPNREVLTLPAHAVSRWEVALLLFGVLGIALGAFQWSASPWFVAAKQAAATWLVEREIFWPLADNAPWWLLTHYPEASDVFTWLDGALIVGYIGATALAVGSFILLSLAAAQKFLGRPGLMWRLAYAFIPLAGVSVFLGLSMLTVTQLRAEGLALAWVPAARAALLALGFGWSAWLAMRLIAAVPVASARRLAAVGAVLPALALMPATWVVQFFVW
ncbi:MAG: 4Fe-4S binding protein [Gammaproteobacteria bacterium]|nr:4Fe-4S binding protein [Gammaproteobacteria bacterium]